MKQNKNFLNALDDWGAVLSDTYEKATITHRVVPSENMCGELVVPEYYAYKYNIQNKQESIKGQVYIPEGVTEINSRAFINCEEIFSIDLPDSIRVIDDYVFAHCTKLQAVSIPDKVEHIQMGVFLKCNSLKNVTFPKYLKLINNFAFSGCSILSGELVIPETVKYVGLFAFADTNLDKIYVPKDMVKNWDEEWNDRCPAEIVYY